MALLEQLKNESAFAINDIQTKPVKKSPAAPFTTSTLQQEAARKLGFSVSQTMSVAQKLYESGKITYMRTDSVNLSSLAINTSRAEIETVYGKEYSKTRQFSTKAKGAQEAHEAIRPTYMNESKVSGSSQEQKLYDLIWKRTIASQMSDAELERTTVTIDLPKDNDLKFVSTGEVLKFDGFLRVYLEDTDDERPPRYTEASLVRKLEELGIGRPSTYAPTISTIQNREYVEKSNIEGVERKYNVLQLKKSKITDSIKTEITGADKNKLKPTDIGIVVNDFLTQSFPSILDYNFTAKVEKQFDNIAEGQEEWTHLIDTFYKSFHPVVDEVMNSHTDHKIGERILGSDPKTGKQVSVKIGRFGPMVQIGTQDDEEKPTFASLQKNQSLTTITLEEALKLFDLPRSVGEYEGKDMQVAVGRFGPYIRHDGKFISLPRGLDPYAVTEEEAVQLIEEKRKKDSEKTISIFGEGDEEIQVLNGRYGPYITYQKGNYKIPKGTDAATLTEEQCKEIIKNTESTSSKSKKTSKTEKKTTKASSEKKGKSTKKSAK